MKHPRLIALLVGILWTGLAGAHSLVSISSPKNTSLKKFAARVQKINHSDLANTAAASYQVRAISPARKPGESVGALYQRILKYSLHRDHPITGDEQGYGFREIKNQDELEAEIARLANLYSGRHLAVLKEVLTSALNTQLLVLVGLGSGNNTVADIIAVVDVKNKQFSYFLYSNFGSDN